jgi:hypothetical protein
MIPEVEEATTVRLALVSRAVTDATEKQCIKATLV